MRVLVVGAGATGGFFGARLAQAGTDVTFLVRPRRAEALRKRGLRITGLGAEDVLTPRLVTAAELTGTYDLVLLSVKATALDAAIADITPAVGPGTAILPVLNGMAHMAALNDAFGPEHVLGGVARVLTTLSADGDIVRLAPLAALEFGEQDGTPSERVDRFRDAALAAGIDAVATTDVHTAMWGKWAFIVSASALTCLMRGTVGDVVAVPGGASLGPALLAEAAAIAAAAGHPLPAEGLAGVEAMLTQPDSPLATSLYRDVVNGNGTEVEHVFGDLVARARAYGVPTPLLDLATLHLRVHQHRVENVADAA